MKHLSFAGFFFLALIVATPAAHAQTPPAPTATDNCLTDGAVYGCGDGFVCKGSPIPTCQSNPVYTSSNGTIQKDGACSTANNSDGNCAGNLVCTAGQCEPPTDGDVGDGSANSYCTTSDQCNDSMTCIANACTAGAGGSCVTDDDCPGNYACLPNPSGGGLSCQSDPSVTNPNAPGANNADNTKGSGAASDPSAAFGWLLGGLMSLFAWLTGAAGVVLNVTIYYTVVQMGNIFNPNNFSAVGVSWRVLRDIGNIVLIFGFIAIGISTIIGYDQYGIKKRLPMLIIVAVLLNFSLFITEAIIDVGNLFATQFYTEINGGQTPSSPTSVANGGVSNLIMNTLQLQTLYNIGGQSQSGNALPQAGGVTDTKIMLTGFLGILLFIVAAFVMFALAFILVARFVMLLFLIVVAPVGFAGLLVPKLESLAQQWWSQLFNQTITAPILILMLYIALAVISDKQFLTGFGASGASYQTISGTANATASGIASYGGLLLVFLVAMGLLLACVMLAKSLSAFGASAATKWAATLSGASVYGLAGRSTLGWASSALARGTRSSALGRTFIGRGLASQFDKGAKATFDFRNIKAASKIGDLGTGQKGGYDQTKKDKIKAYESAAKDIKGRKKTAAEIALENQHAEAVNAAQGRLASVGIRVADTGMIYDLKKKETKDARADAEAKKAAVEAAKKEVADARAAATDPSQQVFGSFGAAGAAARQSAAQAALTAAEQNAAQAAQKATDAQKAQTESQKKMTAAQQEFQRTNQIVDRTKQAQTKVAAQIKEATSDAAAQRAYAARLKGRWRFATGASAAAASIEKKAKEDPGMKAINAAIKAQLKAEQADSGGKKAEEAH